MAEAWQYGLRQFWRRRGVGNVALLPFSALFWLLSSLRRLAYRLRIYKVRRFKVPVVVVGSLTAGGGGKTTLVAALAAKLSEHGLKVGIVSRGYGRRVSKPMLINPADARTLALEDASYDEYGDEALMLASTTGASVVVGADRPAAIEMLLELGADKVDVLVSDDGLQHYAMGRDVEIVVLSESYGLGNGWLLPAGPLRERRGRLKQVDHIVRKGRALPGESGMQLGDGKLATLDGASVSQAQLADKKLAAVAGIAGPEDFFFDLERLGLRIDSSHCFADHHRYRSEDLAEIKADFLIMTAKDAIKCMALNEDKRIVVFTQHVQLDSALINQLVARIARSKSA